MVIQMKRYEKKVNLENRREMIQYLTKHFRYWTMNSWNQSTSYAQNVKVYNLGLSQELEEKLYKMLGVKKYWNMVRSYLIDFAHEHNFLWQADFNGKSNGYLVLYSGNSRRSEYKSRCLQCGQMNYKTVEESGNCRCGKCGGERVNFESPPVQLGIYPGRSIDSDENFKDWEFDELVERVKLVQSFDRLCDRILDSTVDFLNRYDLVERYVTKQVKEIVLVEVT